VGPRVAEKSWFCRAGPVIGLGIAPFRQADVNRPGSVSTQTNVRGDIEIPHCGFCFPIGRSLWPYRISRRSKPTGNARPVATPGRDPFGRRHNTIRHRRGPSRERYRAPRLPPHNGWGNAAAIDGARLFTLSLSKRLWRAHTPFIGRTGRRQSASRAPLVRFRGSTLRYRASRESLRRVRPQ
jgi:hypothetical protein